MHKTHQYFYLITVVIVISTLFSSNIIFAESTTFVEEVYMLDVRPINSEVQVFISFISPDYSGDNAYYKWLEETKKKINEIKAEFKKPDGSLIDATNENIERIDGSSFLIYKIRNVEEGIWELLLTIPKDLNYRVSANYIIYKYGPITCEDMRGQCREGLPNSGCLENEGISFGRPPEYDLCSSGGVCCLTLGYIEPISRTVMGSIATSPLVTSPDIEQSTVKETEEDSILDLPNNTDLDMEVFSGDSPSIDTNPTTAQEVLPFTILEFSNAKKWLLGALIFLFLTAFASLIIIYEAYTKKEEVYSDQEDIPIE